MKWTKIPTEFLYLPDRDIAALAKYCMLYGILERVPTRSECLRNLSEKQLETVQKHIKILSKIISRDINVAQYDRDRKKQKRLENREKSQKSPTEHPTEHPTDGPTESPTHREIREIRESNTIPGGNVLQRASAREIPPPTLDEVLAYAKQQTEMAGVGGFPCAPYVAEQFWAHYQSQGWRKSNDAETPVRDWRAALRMWARGAGPGRNNAPPSLINNDDLPI